MNQQCVSSWTVDQLSEGPGGSFIAEWQVADLRSDGVGLWQITLTRWFTSLTSRDQTSTRHERQLGFRQLLYYHCRRNLNLMSILTFLCCFLFFRVYNALCKALWIAFVYNKLPLPHSMLWVWACKRCILNVRNEDSTVFLSSLL